MQIRTCKKRIPKKTVFSDAHAYHQNRWIKDNAPLQQMWKITSTWNQKIFPGICESNSKNDFKNQQRLAVKE